VLQAISGGGTLAWPEWQALSCNPGTVQPRPPGVCVSICVRSVEAGVAQAATRWRGLTATGMLVPAVGAAMIFLLAFIAVYMA